MCACRVSIPPAVLMQALVLIHSSYTPSWVQQTIRGVCYGSQFTAAFLVSVDPLVA